MAPEYKPLEFVATDAGVFNAVAFWHDLQMERTPAAGASSVGGTCAPGRRDMHALQVV